MNRTNTRYALATAAALALAAAAHAETTITIDSVTQRWPWNNKLDITYTVTGGQDVSGGLFRKIVFSTEIGGTTYTIDGVSDVGASANNGQHTVTWTAPDGVKSDNCTMSAAIYEADVPSGDDYMVIDLSTGAVTWEGLYATQAASNARYNTDAYKKDKLVLRKVPAGGPYQVGYSGTPNNSTPKTYTTDRDYYIGVFEITHYQYVKIGADTTYNPGYGNSTTRPIFPAHNVSWDDLRLSTTASTSAIPAVATSGTGTFLQRLNYITGNKFGFDLPTEVMFEIAQRAGSTSAYSWGDTPNADYVICSDNGNNIPADVGSRLPNAWGLYDMSGNMFDWCRDVWDGYDMNRRVDAFTPAYGNGNYRMGRGGCFKQDSTSDYFKASWRWNGTHDSRSVIGFRVSMIRE